MVGHTQQDTAAGWTQACLDPRLPGGVNVSGATQRMCEVVAVYRGDDARAALA